MAEKNPAFRRRRTVNRLDSATVGTVGVNSSDLRCMRARRKKAYVT